MIEEQFAHGRSLLHRLDPRGKIVAAICFTVTVAVISSFTALAAALVFSTSLLLAARLPTTAVVKRLLLVNGFTLFLWITLPLTYGEAPSIAIGIFQLSHQGIELAARITLKTNTIIMAIIALLTTSTIADLGSGMDRLGFPKKLCFILLYSYRYVFVIYQEYMRLFRAAKMRAFAPATNMHTYRTFAYLFGMTLVKSYNRSHRVHQAMLLRGFNGRLVSLYRHSFTLRDALFVSLCVIVSGLVIGIGTLL